ncbi:hypothetical protein KAR91_06450 [Candidatus Pacearchaeota archaeon]|nr:hypothetical protein [Candidatus Pacearchaeota archaeon]
MTRSQIGTCLECMNKGRGTKNTGTIQKIEDIMTTDGPTMPTGRTSQV